MDQYKKTFEAYDKLANAYQDKFMDLDLYNDTYDIFCNAIRKPNAKIFEIGCGPGNITRYLLSQKPDLDILAIDMAPNMIKMAKQNNATANFMVMDARKIDSIKQKFDGIMCGFCIPYLSKDDCAKLIKDCAVLLEQDGILYVSAIEDLHEKSAMETSSNGQYSMFVYCHQADYLEVMLHDSGFELTDCIRKKYAKQDGTFSTHLIMITKKRPL